jgi:hypothetical protein
VAAFTIDLRARLVSDDLQIWRVFPGADYVFLQEFEKQSVVFLDFPGLPLEVGPVSEQMGDLAERILVARAISQWAWECQRADRDGQQRPAEPSRNPADYAHERRPRNLSIDKGAVAGLFGKPAKGDLVIVPTPISHRRVLVGEFLHGPERRTVAVARRYGNEGIPARAVRWFPAINELEVPERLSGVIRRPNPFVSFDRGLYREVFDHTFGTYVFKDQYSARFDTLSERFTSENNLDFIVLAEAIAQIVAESDGGRDISTFPRLVALALSDRMELYKTNLTININSPGSFLSQSASIVPLVFCAMLSLFQSANAADAIPQVNVVNSLAADPSDACTPAVDSQVRHALEFMQIEVWREACERSVRLRQSTQMQGVAKTLPVVTEPPKAPAR